MTNPLRETISLLYVLKEDYDDKDLTEVAVKISALAMEEKDLQEQGIMLLIKDLLLMLCYTYKG